MANLILQRTPNGKSPLSFTLAPRIPPFRLQPETPMREILSILADVATIVTALCATGILVRINIHLSNNASKNADQRASGTNNKQNIKQ